jgi:DnaJ-class molecular chaperone
MAALGGEMMIATVDGPKQLKIAAGIQNGTTQVMREMGVPRFNNPTRRGDQIVHLIVETPTKLAPEEKKLLEKLAELRSEQLHLTPEELAEIELKKEAAKEAAAAEVAAKAGAGAKSKAGKKEEEKEKEDGSLIDKIVEAFRPKNGDEAK